MFIQKDPSFVCDSGCRDMFLLRVIGGPLVPSVDAAKKCDASLAAAMGSGPWLSESDTFILRES
jgi:hypothetical protein